MQKGLKYFVLYDIIKKNNSYGEKIMKQYELLKVEILYLNAEVFLKTSDESQANDEHWTKNY